MGRLCTKIQVVWIFRAQVMGKKRSMYFELIRKTKQILKNSKFNPSDVGLLWTIATSPAHLPSRFVKYRVLVIKKHQAKFGTSRVTLCPVYTWSKNKSRKFRELLISRKFLSLGVKNFQASLKLGKISLDRFG